MNDASTPKFSRETASSVLDIIQSFAISFTIYLLIFHFIAQPQRVLSVSMQPNFFENDRLVVEKISYRIGAPQRGDVVVFKFPDNEEIVLIKRIIGLPGETIEIRDNTVFIDGKKLDEPYLLDQKSTIANTYMPSDTPILINQDEYITMGDNRLQSGDSRIWGPVDDDLIIGQAVFRFWPINRIGIIQQPDYTLTNTE